MLKNLKFILTNEPVFPGVEKLFVLNRLFDFDQQEEALKLIAEHGYDSLIIPFVPDEYASLGWDIEPFGSVNFFSSPQFSSLDHQLQMRMRILACGPKVRYAMGINGARNAIIEVGKGHAEWTVVLDGNCVFTKVSFERFRRDCQSWPFTPYKIVPMHRLEDNASYQKLEPDPKSKEEPQIAFHNSAQCQFDERFPYGFRDKTSLLKTLGVPGAWQHWWTPEWAPSEGPMIAERYLYRFTKGAVFRLSSGRNGLEDAHAQIGRHNSRNYAILKTIDRLNNMYGSVDPQVSDAITSLTNVSYMKSLDD
jgi:hypothetical protein